MSGKYIVMFKEGTPKEVIDKAAADIVSQGGVIGHRYDSSILGFSAELPDNVLTTFVKHEHVDAVEADGTVSAFAKSLGVK
eukprot:jgi/Hompol1/462/HPOL_005315-RA